jgi:coenzyme F420-reducing hydrogenase alpha subunit
MKKALVILAAFTFSVGAASAQTVPVKNRHPRTAQAGKAQKTPEQKADQKAKHLAQQLNLSAEQTEKVRQLHLARYQEMQANRAKYATAGKTDARKQEMKADKAAYDAQLKQILSADQYTKYAQLRAEKAEKHKGHQKAKS